MKRGERCTAEHHIDRGHGRTTYPCMRRSGHKPPHRDWYGREFGEGAIFDVLRRGGVAIDSQAAESVEPSNNQIGMSEDEKAWLG